MPSITCGRRRDEVRPSRCLATLLLLALPFFAGSSALAVTYVVDRLTDSVAGACTASPNDCALRGAILAANAHAGADVVLLSLPGTYTLSIAGTGEDAGQTGDLDVLEELLLLGLGPERTTINAAGIDRAIHLRAPGEKLILRGVTVTGGDCAAGDDGGGISSQEGELRLEVSYVLGNNCSGAGGGVHAVGCVAAQRLEIVDSWIGVNDANIYGGIYSGCPLYLERSTVSGNTAETNIAGVGVLDSGSYLLHSTITGNVVSQPGYPGGVRIAGGVEVQVDGCTFTGNVGAALHVDPPNSTVLMNTAIHGTCGGTVVPFTIGGNLESPGHTCGFGATDLEDVVDPGLGALDLIGGPTPVHRPLTGSPLIDVSIAGPNCSLLDQRRLSRPRDGDGTGGPDCDIGAVELAGPAEIFVDGFECSLTTAWSAVAP